MKRPWLGLLVALPLSAAVADGPAYRVRDIKTADSFQFYPWPAWRELVEFDGSVYFATSDGVHGEELWRWSEGGGVEMVADLCPGACPSYPYELTPFDGALYFTATEERGRELWRIGAATEEAELVADLVPGLGSSSPFFLTPLGDRLFFAAGDAGFEDRELWSTDGTAAGTMRVADIVPGEEGSDPVALVSMGESLYFTAADESHGRELWHSDGTSDGTERLLDLCPGPDDCHWEEQWFMFGRRTLHPVGAGLLLDDVEVGFEGDLALYDPASGDVDVLPVTANVFYSFFMLGGSVVFDGCDLDYDCEPWRSDGTVAGTHRILDVVEGPEGSSPEFLGAAGTAVYFVAYRDSTGSELWMSDGTASGTQMLRLLHPSPSNIDDFVALPGVALGDRLVFAVNDGVHGKEPWVTDGTAEGTYLLRDIYPGEYGSSTIWAPVKMAVSGETAILFAHDPERGLALWRTDGTSAGTELVADLDDQVDGLSEGFLHGSILRGGRFGEELLFAADDGSTGVELWVSDGTEAGTRLVEDLEPGVSGTGVPDSSDPMEFAVSGGVGFVAGYRGVWSTDGSSSGTERLAGDWAGRPIATRTSSTSLAEVEAFFAGGEETGVFRSDGSPEGTIELLSGAFGSPPQPIGRVLFFTRGDELWLIEEDGVTPRRVATIAPGDHSSSMEILGAAAGDLLFAVDDGVAGRELWRSDGTAEGTELVLDVRAGPLGSDPDLPEFHDRPAATRRGLFFVADDGTTGRELWVSDATGKGTNLVVDAREGAIGSDPSELVAAGERLFFFANDGATGRELWMTSFDGVARRVRDIRPGPDSSIPLRRIGSRMIAVGNHVYFGGTNGRDGVELWTSDGTAAGTRQLQDINPGPGSSSPENFVIAGNCLYFSATDGATGFELWAMPLGPGSNRGRSCRSPEGGPVRR